MRNFLFLNISLLNALEDHYVIITVFNLLFLKGTDMESELIRS